MRKNKVKDLPSVNPRIIAMTANATQEDRRLCFQAGMDDYISKPVRIQDLAQALASAGRIVPSIQEKGDHDE